MGEADRARSFAEWLFGGVAVPANERDLGSFLGTSHNMYVDMLDMYGLVGLALLAIVMVRIWRGPPGWPRWTHLVLAAVFVFGLFYPWPAWSWVLVGFLPASSTRSGMGLGCGLLSARESGRLGRHLPPYGGRRLEGATLTGRLVMSKPSVLLINNHPFESGNPGQVDGLRLMESAGEIGAVSVVNAGPRNRESQPERDCRVRPQYVIRSPTWFWPFRRRTSFGI